MAVLKAGDKVIYEGKKSLYFDVGKCYTITNTSIYLVDNTKEEHKWDYNHFFGSFSLPNTLQVSQTQEDVRSYNVGQSDYSKHKIQPWDIWLEYNLNPWDADIIKRILRTKETDSRKLDYEKIIHIAKERIRQLDLGYK
jgi:hypothetical protein